jgi:hypothetical protein
MVWLSNRIFHSFQQNNWLFLLLFSSLPLSLFSCGAKVEDPSVFLSEAVGLSALAKTETLLCPKPLHLGRLPKVSMT